MTERSYPFLGNGPTQDAEFSALFRDAVGTGVRFVDDLSLQVFSDSSGMKVKVRAGEAGVRGHWYKNTAEKEMPIDPTGVGITQPRVDTIILRLDYTVKSIVLAVKKGSPAANPVAPALTQTDSGIYEFPLNDVRVDVGAVTILATKTTDRRTFLVNGVPAGTLSMFAGGSVPAGYLLADGRVMARSDYPRLYAALGTAYNTGGETALQFRLPNLKGRVPVGLDSAQAEFNALGKLGGEKAHQLTTAELASHAHGQRVVAGTPGGSISTRFDYSGEGVGNVYAQGGVTTDAAGSDQAHNNLQPYIALNFIVKT